MFFEMQETYNERAYSIHEQSAVATDVVFLLMCVCVCVQAMEQYAQCAQVYLLNPFKRTDRE